MHHPDSPFAQVTRRRFLVGLGSAAAAAAFLAACGEDAAEPTPAGTEAADATATPAEPTAVPAFPVSIPHKFGTTELASAPQRVITLGYSEQDPVLALGVVPIAVREWFGEKPYAVWPWAEAALGAGQPQVLSMPFGELDFEAITALAPDLIVATHSGITEQEYETLVRIAPTLAQPAEYPDFGVSWEEQTRLIARALGREAVAEDAIAGVESAITAAAASHPAFAGATAAWAIPAGDGQYWVVGPNTPPMRFLAALGFRMPEALAAVVGEQDSVQISGEQVDLLDADVLIVQAYSEEGRLAMETDPLVSQLRAVAEGRIVFFTSLDDPGYGALSFSTVLSLPFAVETLIPRLAGAVDGDSGTPA